MFDSFILNMLTSVARSALAGLAVYFASIGIMPTGGEDKFVAAGLVFVNLAWAAYEKKIAGKAIAVAALALFFITPFAMNARAGDIAFKAPSFAISSPCTLATPATPLSCSGFYIGGGISGQGSNADIIGSGINGSVFAGGMVPQIDAGYQYISGNWLFGGEFDLGYAINSNINVNNTGSSVNGFRTTELFKVGGNLAGLLGTAPPITVPAALANSVLGMYGGIGATQWQMPGALASGTSSAVGFLFDIGPKWFGDMRYTYTNFNSAKVNNVVIQNDQSLSVRINYKF